MWKDLKARQVMYVDKQARGMTELVRLNCPTGMWKSRKTDAYISKDMLRTERAFQFLDGCKAGVFHNPGRQARDQTGNRPEDKRADRLATAVFHRAESKKAVRQYTAMFHR